MPSYTLLLLLVVMGSSLEVHGVAIKRSLGFLDYGQQLQLALAQLADYSPALTLASPQGQALGSVAGIMRQAHNLGVEQDWQTMASLLRTSPAVFHQPALQAVPQPIPQPTLPPPQPYTTIKPVVEHKEEFHGGYDDDEGDDGRYEDEEENIQDDKYERQYKYGYRVSDHGKGTEFGQTETRKGRLTTGHYHVLLPDGRMQNVEYWSDDTGYHVHISYDAPARHLH